MTFYLTEVNVPSKSNKQKNLKNSVLLVSRRSRTKIVGSGSGSRIRTKMSRIHNTANKYHDKDPKSTSRFIQGLYQYPDPGSDSTNSSRGNDKLEVYIKGIVVDRQRCNADRIRPKNYPSPFRPGKI